MIVFEGWTVPRGFSSDGCTFPGLLGIFKPIMRAKKYKPACVMHDFLRRHICHYDMRPNEADAIFRRHLKALGASSLLATIYWFSVKIMRNKFKITQPLPEQWKEYRYGIS